MYEIVNLIITDLMISYLTEAISKPLLTTYYGQHVILQNNLDIPGFMFHCQTVSSVLKIRVCVQ